MGRVRWRKEHVVSTAGICEYLNQSTLCTLCESEWTLYTAELAIHPTFMHKGLIK